MDSDRNPSAAATTGRDRRFASTVFTELIIRCVDNTYDVSEEEKQVMTKTGSQAFNRAAMYGIGSYAVVYLSTKPLPMGKLPRALIAFGVAGFVATSSIRNITETTIIQLTSIPKSRMGTELKIIMAEMEGVQGPFQKEHGIPPIDFMQLNVQDDALDRMKATDASLATSAPSGMFGTDQDANAGMYHLISAENRVGDRKDTSQSQNGSGKRLNSKEEERQRRIVQRIDHRSRERDGMNESDQAAETNLDGFKEKLDKSEANHRTRPRNQPFGVAPRSSEPVYDMRQSEPVQASSSQPRERGKRETLATREWSSSASKWDDTSDKFQVDSNKFVSSDDFADKEKEFTGSKDFLVDRAQDLDVGYSKGDELTPAQRRAAERQAKRERAKAQRLKELESEE